MAILPNFLPWMGYQYFLSYGAPHARAFGTRGALLKIARCTCGDGKERRISTGNSSAKSTYPIPEAPEHQSQLGDMKIICPEPVWTVSDAEGCQKKFETELCGKAPTKEKHREFAKQNLGNTGHKNLNGTPLSEYYPGTAHLGFGSAETLCLLIAKIAAGKMCLFKLVYTDSDCIVPENIHIFFREVFFGLNPPRHQKFLFSYFFLLSLKQWG